MDGREILLSVVMVASALLMGSRFPQGREPDPLLVAGAVLLAAALAAMIASTSYRLSRLEEEMKASQRAMRIGMQGIEDRMEKADSINLAALEDISKRLYR
jgi:hypothetical protein